MAKNGSYSLTLGVVDNTSKPLEKVNKNLQKLGAPAKSLDAAFSTSKLTLGMTRLGRGLQNVRSTATGLASSITRVITPLAGLGSLLSIAGFAKVSEDTARWGTALDGSSRLLGISASRLSTWQNAAKLSGASAESITQTFSNLRDKMVDFKNGDSFLAPVGKMIGLNVDDDIETAFKKVSEGLRSNKFNVAQKEMIRNAFGISPELQRMIEDSTGVQGFFNRAQRVSGVSEDQVRQARALGDAYNGVTVSVQAMLIRIAAIAAPGLVTMLNSLTGFLSSPDGVKMAEGIGASFGRMAIAISEIDWRGVIEGAKAFGAEIGDIMTKIGRLLTWADKLTGGGSGGGGGILGMLFPGTFGQAPEAPGTTAQDRLKANPNITPLGQPPVWHLPKLFGQATETSEPSKTTSPTTQDSLKANPNITPLAQPTAWHWPSLIGSAQAAETRPQDDRDKKLSATAIATTVAATLRYLDLTNKINDLGRPSGADTDANGAPVAGNGGGSSGGDPSHYNDRSGGPGSAATVPLDRVKMIHDRIANALHLPEKSISALIGAGVGESGLNTRAVGGAGELGMWQWLGARQGKNWQEFAPGKSLHDASPELQTDYLIHELQGKYKGVFNALNKPDISTGEANSVVTHRFESPANADVQAAKRLPMTDEIYRRLNNGQNASPAPTTAQNGQIEVTIKHENAPRGSRASAETSGPAFNNSRQPVVTQSTPAFAGL